MLYDNKHRICTHPNAYKDYGMGSHSGDYICNSCGMTFTGRKDWYEEQERARQILAELEAGHPPQDPA